MHRWFRAIWRRIYTGRNKVVNVLGTLTIEAVAVALGVFGGLLAENWNENRLERKTEMEKLMEIRSNLIGDLADLRENYFAHQKAAESANMLIQHLEKDLPYDDSLLNHYSNLQVLTFFNTRSGAYEALKSNGVELITNKALRNRLVKLYDFNYEQIFRMDRNQETDYEAYEDFARDQFILDTARSLMVLKDYDHLKTDRSYFDLLVSRRQSCSTYKQVYQNYAFQVNNLVDQINHELYGQDQAPDTIQVTFTLRKYPDAKEVKLHGSFLPWDKEYLPMTFDEDLGFWVSEVYLYPNVEYSYWFNVDGSAINDPDNPNYEFDGYAGYMSLVEFDEKEASRFY